MTKEEQQRVEKWKAEGIIVHTVIVNMPSTQYFAFMRYVASQGFVTGDIGPGVEALHD